MAREFWNYVDCVNNENFSLIETSLAQILTKEGFKQLNNLPDGILTEEINFCTSEEIYWRLIREVLLIGLFPGASGWTFIKTQPREFLCRRGKNSHRPRLSKLATLTKSEAFHWSAYQDNFGILLEANEQKNIFVSGSHYLSDEAEESWFYQEKINFNQEWKFHLLNMPEEIKDAIKPETREELEEKSIRLSELYSLDNQSFDAFKEIMDLTIGSGTIADTSLWRSIGNSSLYWRKKTFYSIRHTEETEIQASGGKLLYFKTPEYYQQLKPLSLFNLIPKY